MKGFSSSSENKVSQSVGEVGRGRSIPFVSQSQIPGFAVEKNKPFASYLLPLCRL